MPLGRHRPPRDPAPGVWILLVLVMAGAALVYNHRHELWALIGLREGPAPGATRDREGLVIHVGGGVLLDPERVPGIEDPGGELWGGLGEVLRRDDLTLVALGCAVAPAEEDGRRCDPEALPVLSEAGVDAAGLANERAAGGEPGSLEGTIEALEGAGIRPVGAGVDAAEATRPALVRTGGRRVALFAFTLRAPAGLAATEERAGVADGRDLSIMTEAVERARSEADLIVVLLDWDMPEDGPDEEHVEQAHALIDAGADAVVGHRPGVLRPMDRHRGRPVFWSVDSLVRPVRAGREIHTALARVVVTADGSVRGRLIPVSIEAPGHPVVRGL